MITDNDRPWTFQEVCEAFNAVASLGPSVIVIDGLDEIGGTLGKTIRQVYPSTHAMLPKLVYIPHISTCHVTFTDCSVSPCKIVYRFYVSWSHVPQNSMISNNITTWIKLSNFLRYY